MLTPAEYLSMDAIAQSESLLKKECNSEELMTAAIIQAQSVNPKLNAINLEFYDSAIEQAKSIDAKTPPSTPSKLAGIPFLIKDLSTVKDLPTTFGSELFKGYIAPSNSNIVQKYVDAGLLIFGKTNTPERGLTLTTEPVANGITRNPWNTDYSTGGSSGGAAAAVAAGIIPAAHATDGGGSIRIPAACCGLFGLKPSKGLTAIENRTADSWSGMSVGHVVSQTVRDSAAYLDVIKLDSPNLYPLPDSGISFFDSLTTTPNKLKIGIQLDHPTEQIIDEECLIAVRTAAGLCEALGHDVEEIRHPINYQSVITAMSRMINLHVYQTISDRILELGLDLESAPLEASTKIMATLGRETTADDYLAARDLVQDAARTMAAFHQQIDVIISPVLSKIPAKIGWLNMNSEDMREYSKRFKSYSGFTSLYNGTGQPSMSVPLHRSGDDLPVGVMFTAAWGHDAQLLQLALSLEESAPWPRFADLA
ncbi:MAG TPA: amidase [Porticoccaceae bacterium]|jgi:Asp-tRNA(Asn)/Glu-tRNA(Gln) amidotransferase A subunit family amidase|nr:amidase [Gammaproteobacteria bacterium]HIL60412.1 amidase [Porticoccaceae bacterium]